MMEYLFRFHGVIRLKFLSINHQISAFPVSGTSPGMYRSLHCFQPNTHRKALTYIMR
jgi:hypothetical protein